MHHIVFQSQAVEPNLVGINNSYSIGLENVTLTTSIRFLSLESMPKYLCIFDSYVKNILMSSNVS